MPNTIELIDLTEATVAGSGAFDVLMRASKAHLEEEFASNRIRGTDYATVYLGSMTEVLAGSIKFLLDKDKAANEAALIEAQVRNMEAQILLSEEQVKLTSAQVDLAKQQLLNSITENELLLKQMCKLEAEYDLIMEQKLKTIQETALLAQKTSTERAQTIEAGVDDNSVIGKQRLLYAAQTNGFHRNAEQSAAKLLVDSWTVRRTTDEGTVADGVNNLQDATIGRVIDKLLTGINA